MQLDWMIFLAARLTHMHAADGTDIGLYLRGLSHDKDLV